MLFMQVVNARIWKKHVAAANKYNARLRAAKLAQRRGRKMLSTLRGGAQLSC